MSLAYLQKNPPPPIMPSINRVMPRHLIPCHVLPCRVMPKEHAVRSVVLPRPPSPSIAVAFSLALLCPLSLYYSADRDMSWHGPHGACLWGRLLHCHSTGPQARLKFNAAQGCATPGQPAPRSFGSAVSRPGRSAGHAGKSCTGHTYGDPTSPPPPTSAAPELTLRSECA